MHTETIIKIIGRRPVYRVAGHSVPVLRTVERNLPLPGSTRPGLIDRADYPDSLSFPDQCHPDESPR